MRGGGGCFDAMQKLEVRQALNMAVDVQTILESLLYGKGVREGGMVNPPYKNEAVKAYEYNPEKAKEIENKIRAEAFSRPITFIEPPIVDEE
jgi:ABC-type transport system substrate-binding protein